MTECRFAHPSDSVSIADDGSVTICMDHEKGRCARDPCRYFHRPDHMKTTSSSAATAGLTQQLAAAAAAAAATAGAWTLMCFLHWSPVLKVLLQ